MPRDQETGCLSGSDSERRSRVRERERVRVRGGGGPTNGWWRFRCAQHHSLTLAEGPYTFTAKRYAYPYTKKRMNLDHENLDVYRVSLEFAAWAYEVCRGLKGTDRHARDQLLRASQSICLNIAEGCGKVPSADRGRFLQIASGSARECGAILDILARCRVLEETSFGHGKALLVRIVAMLTRMIQSTNQVREESIVYGYVNENGYGAADGQPMAGGDSAARNTTA